MSTMMMMMDDGEDNYHDDDEDDVVVNVEREGDVNDYNEVVEYDVDICDIITVDVYRYDGKNIYNIFPQSMQCAKICL